MYWINGRLCDAVTADDRGIQFGDGCFTTAKVSQNSIEMLPWHIERLQQATNYLMIAPLDWQMLEAEMKVAANSITAPLGVVKVIITRGSGGRGYSFQGVGSPTRIVISSCYPQHYLPWREQGIELTVSPIRLARHEQLAGIKHLNRLEQILIRAYLDKLQAQEALVLDTEGFLIECCAANLFWRKGQRVFTPDLHYAGVLGLMRRRVLELLKASSIYTLEVVRAPLEALSDADEVMICNALMPILSVNKAHIWRYESRELYDFCNNKLCTG